MFPIKNIVAALSFIAFCCGTLHAKIDLILEKKFAVTNEFFSLVAQVENATENSLIYLNVRDNQGRAIMTIPARVNEGKAIININIPSDLKTDWYHFTVFTISEETREVQEFVQIGIPIYSDKDIYSKIESSQSEALNFLACTSQEAELEGYIKSESVVKIGQLIQNPMVHSSENSTSLTISSKHEILFELGEKDGGKSFYAFLNKETRKVSGLRKSQDQVYSLSTDQVNHSLNGQILSLGATGDVKTIQARVVDEEFGLPDVNEIKEAILMNELISEYIERHKKRLKIQSLYEQSYFQSKSAQNPAIASLSYQTSDYIQFNSTEEFINEVLQVVKYNTRKKSFSVLNEDKVWNNTNPLVLLNGKAVSAGKVLSMIKYADLISIEIFRLKDNLRENFSSFGRAGVLVFNTKTNQVTSDLSWNSYNKVDVKFNAAGGPSFLESYLNTSNSLEVIQTETKYLVLSESGKTCKLEIKKAN